MIKKLSLDTLDKKVQEFFKGIQITEDQYLIETNDKPMLMITSPEQNDAFPIFDEIWRKNKEADEKEVEKDVAEAIANVRAGKE